MNYWNNDSNSWDPGGRMGPQWGLYFCIIKGRKNSFVINVETYVELWKYPKVMYIQVVQIITPPG